MIGKTIQMYGLHVLALDSKYHREFEEVIPKLLKSRQLKYAEDITKGLEHAGDAILGQQQGIPIGKSLVLVAE